MILFNERLKELRIEKGLNQRQLGELLSVSPRTVSSWEADERRPDFETLEKIAKYFGVTTDYLLGLED